MTERLTGLLQDRFKLNLIEARFVAALYRQSGTHARRALHRSDPEFVRVRMDGLRRKLTPGAIRIETIWGRGYRLTDESREKLRALIGHDGTTALDTESAATHMTEHETAQ